MEGDVFTRLFIILCICLSLLSGCGSGNDCDQDYPPPSEISTTSNPYTFSTLSSDLGIVSTRWENLTTSASGSGTVTQVYECVFPIGCGTWSRLVNTVPLSVGYNLVFIYNSSDGCEWRDDYAVTLN